MSVNFEIKGNYYHLYNNSISYILKRLPNDMFEHIYFGNRLYDLDEEDYEYLHPTPGKPSGAIKYDREQNLYLANRSIEYPVFGTGDFKTGAFALEKDGMPVYPDLKLEKFEMEDGIRVRPDFPGVRLEKGARTFSFYFLDTVFSYRLILDYVLYENDPVIVKSARIENMDDSSLLITGLASGVLHPAGSDYEVIYLSGNWAREFQIQKAKVDHADLVIDSKYGASSHKHNPYMALVNENQCYTTNLIYSGNFANRVQSDEFGNLRVISGCDPETFSILLDKNEIFESPQCFQAFTDQGLQKAAIINQTFIRSHIVNPYWKNQVRPVVVNSWESLYFSLNEDNLYDLAKAAKQVGADCLVVDDGWFGHRDIDATSLGDWFTDLRKFPSGLGHLAKKVHDLGLQFGLWFEPEMVNEDSKFYKEHPEFVVRPKKGRYSYGRDQLVLDFTNPDCIEAVYAQMKKIIEETHLDFIKWDMNRNITEAYSPYLEKTGRSQKEFYYRYICGVYSLHQMILNDFPHVLIEGCAAGGGRFDAGILYYAPQIWTSDDTDAYERLAIQQGAYLAYPLSSISNHISAVPNHQTFRTTSLKIREEVAFFGIMGLELNLLKCTDEEKNKLQVIISRYKKHRAMLLEANIRTLEFNDIWRIFYVNAPNSRESFCGFFNGLLHLKTPKDERVKLPDIQSESVYQIKNWKIKGSVLKQAGLKKPLRFNGVNLEQADFKGDFQSEITEIIRNEEE